MSNLRYADDTTLMAESEEELKILLMKVKEEGKKVGLKLNIQKTKIMASGPITSWEIDGETVSDFIFGGSKITEDVMSQLFASSGQSIGASASVLPMNIQDCFPLGWTGWISLQSKGLSRVFSSTTLQKHQLFGTQPSSQSNSHIHT